MDLTGAAPLMGTMLSEIYIPNVIRLLAGCGCAYMVVDCEHGYFDLTQVANLSAVASGIGMPLLVRAAAPDRALIPKYLDMGVDGILLANTADKAEAQALVDICRYAPEGTRGVSTFRAHTDYRSANTEVLLRQANERIVLFCQIESESAADQSEDILNVSGIDGALIGPNDMSQRMGILGQYTNPRMLRSLERVAVAARDVGKTAGVATANEALMRVCTAMGMRMFCVGSELHFLASGAKEAFKNCATWLG
jgi:2-dehydro-3-deoxyglucarate aldolase/4-hydroxy-2-oxoheptanedioate aldolase